MSPIPRPTKETITKASIKGLEVIAPINEPIQVTEEVTMLPASARIAARVPAAGAPVKHTTFQNIFAGEIYSSDMDQISDDPNRKNSKSEANEIAHRLSHEEIGKLGQEPTNESLHISHEAKHLPA